MNAEVKIYANYGVLAHEKRAVYTYGAPQPTATCYDELTVRIPDGWTLFRIENGREMVTAPWGIDYDINEVLSTIDEKPAFNAYDNDREWKKFPLEIVSDEKAE